MRPNTPAALRQSLEAKFTSQSSLGQLSAAQLRRRFVFQRVLRRLGCAGGWVLKGGFLLEARIPAGARATKDIDFATAGGGSQDDLVDRLQDALEEDEDGDFLVFEVSRVVVQRMNRRGLASWRITLTASMDGREFDRVILDIAERLEEVQGGTERFDVPPVVFVEGLGTAQLPAVDVVQHAAEKFHALCLEFDDGRSNTRTKDLVDIVLMYEAGMLPDARLKERLIWVFQHRDDALPPPDLPRYPRMWEADYAQLTSDLTVSLRSVEEAHRVASEIYRDATSNHRTTIDKEDN